MSETPYRKGMKAPRVQTATKPAECSHPDCTLLIEPGMRYVRLLRMSGRSHEKGDGRVVPSALPRNGIQKFHVACSELADGEG